MCEAVAGWWYVGSAVLGGLAVFGLMLSRFADPLCRLQQADPVAYAALVRKAFPKKGA